MIAKFQAWLNANPRAKYLLSSAEGASFGVIVSYLVGVVNGTGTFTWAGLKRTIATALVTGITAAYNLWKVPPTNTNQSRNP